MYTMPIERGKIREFALATHNDHPDHQGEDAVAPPTFLTIAGLAWEPADESPLAELGFDLERVLHGEEEYVIHGHLPRAGTVVTVEARVAERFEKDGRRGGRLRFAVIVREFRDDAGDLIAEQRTTVVETAHAPEKT